MNRRMIPVAAVAALGLAGAFAAAAPVTARDRLDDALLAERLADFAALTDGSVLVEVRDGGDVWREAAGLRGIEDDARPARPGDRVRIGSVTKSMIAAVVLQLDGEGALDLDDPVGDHLPGLLPYEEDPTIRQLLQHTSGLRDWVPIAYPGLAEGDLTEVREGYRTHYEPEELIDLATREPLLFDPGDGWAYANTGYTVLGLLIEEHTGRSLGRALDERVFEPAGLDRTYLPRPHTTGFRGPHAVPYLTTGDPADPYFDATDVANSQLGASGGVVSTVRDVNDFYDALTDGTLLTADQLAEAVRFTDTGEGFQYGLGLGGIALGCPGDPEEVFIGHVGDGIGHQTQTFHSLDGDRQITVSWSIDDKHGHHDPAAFGQALGGLLTAGLCRS
ncbi:serine hydrolase domain-containing protein [Glycomyces terrestris]|uniref:Class A beta-lactamase-related serine hydrolase n=1 Tax=Glycomyces terrestris TaxID=2493553 RepID=A0A426V3A0_9ACTN|nr:serine hydrolase domain-containing protein [Glycomyces terrestris]RRS01325.1 class A beta-lactamase-related serine hydrolase [Glycomyces terrestris]